MGAAPTQPSQLLPFCPFASVHFDPELGDAATPADPSGQPWARKGPLSYPSTTLLKGTALTKPPSHAFLSCCNHILINGHSQESLIIGFQVLKGPLFVLTPHTTTCGPACRGTAWPVTHTTGRKGNSPARLLRNVWGVGEGH